MMCLPSGGQLSLVIVSSFYVCSALSNPNASNSEALSKYSQNKKEANRGLKGENKIHKFLRESLKRKMQNTIFQLELQLFESQNESLIGQKNQKDQKNSKTEMRSNFEKRSPKCLFQCLRFKHLHPAQCHYLCTMTVG